MTQITSPFAKSAFLPGANLRRSLEDPVKPHDTSAFPQLQTWPIPACSHFVIISLCDVDHNYPPAKGVTVQAVARAETLDGSRYGDAVTQIRASEKDTRESVSQALSCPTSSATGAREVVPALRCRACPTMMAVACTSRATATMQSGRCGQSVYGSIGLCGCGLEQCHLHFWPGTRRRRSSVEDLSSGVSLN